MPPRSSVTAVPDEVRVALDERLRASSFSGYEGLSEWLKEQGFQISRAALQRYGSKMEKRLDQLKTASDKAREVIEACQDEGGNIVAQAAANAIQTQIFETLIDDENPLDLDELTTASVALAKAAPVGIKLRDEQRKLLADAAGRAEKAMRKKGVSQDVLEAMREAVEGS